MVLTRHYFDLLAKLFFVKLLCLGIIQPSHAEPIKEGEMLEILFVQSAASGSFDGETLTLNDVGPTGFFTDRPQRIAGHVRTANFLKIWDEGNNSFETDPPNANVSLFGGDAPDNIVVELGHPKLEGTTLSYSVKILKGELPDHFGEISMVIDAFGRWAAAAGGAMIGGAIGRNRGYAEGAASATPDHAYTSAPPTPCVCNCQ